MAHGHARNKREYKEMQTAKTRKHISYKSDNRVVCIATGRQKFVYPTLKKAELACSYSGDDLQRPYYCKGCCGWHTTSKTQEEYYQTLEDIGIKEVTRSKHKAGFVSKDKKILRHEQSFRDKLQRNAGKIKEQVEHTMRVAMCIEYPFYY